MNKKILDNLKTAFSELIGVADSEDLTTQEQTTDVAPLEPSRTLDEDIEENAPVLTRHQKGIICDGMEVLGDVITTDADLEVYGKVKGNITSNDGTVYIFNSHEGNITANTIVVSQCSSIVGNLNAKETIQIDTDTVLKGNLNAGGSVFINGRIFGNATASSEIYFGSDALIKGDITSNGIVVTKGAKIYGAITCTSDGNEA